jgi:hypothetical protein
MNRILRTLLIWIIIAALPIQATAAVVKASCGSAHHPAQMQNSSFSHSSVADAHPHEPLHEHMTMEVHHAHAHQALAHAEFADGVFSESSAAGSPSSSDQADNAHSTCSACAACCVGAVAPPPAQVKAPDFTEFKKSNLVSSRLLAGFIPPGLERPPRFILA